jgi:hypothetical protein
MDEFHRKLAHTGLQVAAHYGFALAGGHAVNVHGFLTRPSADVDLFGALDADLATASAEVVSRTGPPVWQSRWSTRASTTCA